MSWQLKMSKTIMVVTLVMVESGGVGDCKYQCHQQCSKKHSHQKQQYQKYHHNLSNHPHNTTVRHYHHHHYHFHHPQTSQTPAQHGAFIRAQKQSLAYCNAAIYTHQHS